MLSPLAERIIFPRRGPIGRIGVRPGCRPQSSPEPSPPARTRIIMGGATGTATIAQPTLTDLGHTRITPDPTIGIAITVTGNPEMGNRKARSMASGLSVLALGPGQAFRRVARIFQRREKIFLALACEFFLRCPEVCNARGDFFTLSSDSLLLFGHGHPF